MMFTLQPNPTARFALLDHIDSILCTHDLAASDNLQLANYPASKLQPLCFAGTRYPISTDTLDIPELITRPDSTTGEMRSLWLRRRHFTVEMTIPDGEIVFSDAPRNEWGECIAFPLSHLQAHFAIPELPTLVELMPAQYQKNLQTLAELENHGC
jgi:hypothetical protein